MRKHVSYSFNRNVDVHHALELILLEEFDWSGFLLVILESDTCSTQCTVTGRSGEISAAVMKRWCAVMVSHDGESQV
jgi:hypothetical protein